MFSEMMDTKEIAKYLNINEKLVYRLAKDKKIPGTRVTGKWIFPKRLIDEWIIQSAQETIKPNPIMRPMYNHIVANGSNDFTIEFLSHAISRHYPEFSLSFSNVGSMGGLLSLGRGCSHVAGCHLLDPITGEYNLPHVALYLPDLRTIVVNLVYRDIGLIVKSGNPIKIKEINDLERPEVTFINRQPGSGTRTLLDIELKRAGIDPEGINGFEKEVNTHMEVGIAVLGGAATTGLGIFAAARRLGLDFVHIAKERYDLVIRRDTVELPPMQALLEMVSCTTFKKIISDLGGYDTRDTGRVLAEY